MEKGKVRKSNDQRSDVKNPNNNDFKVDRKNTQKQIKKGK